VAEADTEQTVITTADLEKDDRGIVRRWVAELALADKAEETWRKEGGEIYDLYEGAETKANSFNILWSNTETLLPAVYNSTPQPDVRRRFRDPDPVGRVASTVLERSLSYQIDDYDFDSEIEDAVLDSLLPGRGVVRINYEPVFVEITAQGAQPAAAAGAFMEPKAPGAGVAGESKPESSQEGLGPAVPAPEPYEKLVSQSATCSHVQWDKFRRGPGKRWPEVPWVAFEHDFTYDMALEKFGERVAKALNYEDTTGSSVIKEGGKNGKETRSVFKTVCVQEIWDREQRRVLFIAPSFKNQPCLVVPDPLKLRGFLPLPRPLYAIPSSRTLVPKPLYRMYKQQAKELDDVSTRINKILKAMKVRGLYSSHIKEAGDLLEAGDNAMLPIENPAMIAEMGGFDKLVWILPLNILAQCLEHLYRARDQIKQTIYEISGIADVLRGSTNPNETLGAQKLKSQWGSLRIQKLKREIQRFARDLMRLKAEVIAEHFTAEQLAAMTSVKLPAPEDKAKAQMAVQQAQAAQQPPPPQAVKALAQPTWIEVKQLMSSDDMRQYRVDIETDSTVAESVAQDTEGMAEVLTLIGNILGGVSKGLPIDVAKSVALAAVRRVRLGSAVEDALEALEQPPAPQAPPPPPDHSLEIAQIKAQSDQARTQMQEQSKVQLAEMKEQAETQRQQFELAMERAGDRYKVELEAAVKVIVAQISASKATQVDPATAASANREFSQAVTQ
jgi:hypothetical protein